MMKWLKKIWKPKTLKAEVKMAKVFTKEELTIIAKDFGFSHMRDEDMQWIADDECLNSFYYFYPNLVFKLLDNYSMDESFYFDIVNSVIEEINTIEVKFPKDISEYDVVIESFKDGEKKLQKLKSWFKVFSSDVLE